MCQILGSLAKMGKLNRTVDCQQGLALAEQLARGYSANVPTKAMKCSGHQLPDNRGEQ